MSIRRPARRAGNLPADVTSFIGRKRELHQIRELLPSTRLLTLTGGAGLGKTRLATRAAETVSRAFPDGVWFADLAPLGDAELLTWTVATAMRVCDRAYLVSSGDKWPSADGAFWPEWQSY
jgi:hypothetical protein